jgi:hypothetical protein
MRRAGSVSEWNFAGLNEIATGWRTALGACTPPTDNAGGRRLCMFDLHSMFARPRRPFAQRSSGTGDGGSAGTGQLVALVDHLLKNYRAAKTPAGLLGGVRASYERGCADYILPAWNTGSGCGDEEGWRGDQPGRATGRSHTYGHGW